jgi:hypothetical protein
MFRAENGTYIDRSGTYSGTDSVGNISMKCPCTGMTSQLTYNYILYHFNYLVQVIPSIET